MWNGQIPCHPIEVVGAVYVEVPKAGCTSVKYALSPFKGGPPTGDVHGWFGYTHARNLAQLYEWLETRWVHFLRFTVVREPVQRFRSFYFGLQRHEQGAYGDIDRYVLEHFERDDWRWNIHIVPQTLLVGSELERFDLIGRTEDLDGFGLVLSEALGRDVVMPHLNRSPVSDAKLSKQAIDRLHTIYAADYTALGY